MRGFIFEIQLVTIFLNLFLKNLFKWSTSTITPRNCRHTLQTWRKQYSQKKKSMEKVTHTKEQSHKESIPKCLMVRMHHESAFLITNTNLSKHEGLHIFTNCQMRTNYYWQEPMSCSFCAVFFQPLIIHWLRLVERNFLEETFLHKCLFHHYNCFSFKY